MDEQRTAWRRLLILGVLLVAAYGCRRASDGVESDSVVQELNRIRPMAVRDHFEDRLDQVLSLRTNNVIDSRPVLLYAVLSTNPEMKPETVRLCLYDEDVDILGVGVQEQYVNANGESVALIEEYPVFTHQPASGSYDYHALPVHVRDAGQRKDTALWDRYAAPDGIDAQRAGNREYYRETLPPIWMSIADPNAIDVYLYLYDRAGNKSELVRLQKGRSGVAS
ncbi:MAG: hypothetical protein ACM3VT_15430 [Solirubrobacterales bacterium]